MNQVHMLVPSVLEVFPECSILVNSASIFEDISFGGIQTHEGAAVPLAQDPHQGGKSFAGVSRPEFVLQHRVPAVEHRARLQPPLTSLVSTRIGLGLRPREAVCGREDARNSAS